MGAKKVGLVLALLEEYHIGTVTVSDAGKAPSPPGLVQQMLAELLRASSLICRRHVAEGSD
jgi:hypothetical protein